MSINYIIKAEFFIAYLAARNTIFTNKNIKTKFKGTKISPYDSNSVISKLDNRLYMSTFFKSHLSISRNWESQTPKTKKKTLSQSNLIKNNISNY